MPAPAKSETDSRADSSGSLHKTVSAHLERVYLKAGVTSRAAATLFAMRHGLLSLEDAGT